jgi:two-component system sensor histidine kinase VicK
MQTMLKTLIVEDREADAALLIRELRRGGYELIFERVDSEPAMTDAIVHENWDIVFADYSMPNFSVAAALAVIAKSGLDVPLIVVSGSVGEESAVEVMRAGAQDLILKHNLKRLSPAVARELEAAKTRRERRASEARLDSERQLLAQLMQGIPDAICFKDIERRYTRLNDAERANLNLDDNTNVLGKTSDMFVRPEIAQARRAKEEHVLATGEPLVDCVDQISDTAGAVRWVSATLAPIRGPARDVVGLVEIARDITESKRQEQLKNEFIATVSHELRTPLTSIMGAVGLLMGGGAGPLTDQATRMLEIALGNSRRLVSIVNDILDIEKIESERMVFSSNPAEIRALLDQAIQANRDMAAQHRVTLRLDDASTECVAMVDPDRLIQVIANLLSNAIKFSPAGAEVVAGVVLHGDRVHIDVRDHGPGIPEDYKDRIFQKFVQVDATDRRKRGGTGLGLSIARQIVSQFNGDISFEAAPGGGTIFRVTLPALAREAPRNEDAQPAPTLLAG